MEKSFVTLLFAWVVGLSTFAQAPNSKTATVPQPPIRVTSSLVLLDVMTRDSKTGLPARDLKKEDFRVFDNGKEVRITTFESGAHFETRPVALWFVVICNEQYNVDFRSGLFFGKEKLFRPPLDYLDQKDSVGVAHWCDNGDTRLDLRPTVDRDAAIKALGKAMRPIPFVAPQGTRIGELALQETIRSIIRDAEHRNPQPLPVLVFLNADYTGMPLPELNLLVDDFLETSGIVFGIRNASVPKMWPLQFEKGEVLHYMAEETGGQYYWVPEKLYAIALEDIIVQLHFRYELGFVPSVLDGKHHELKVELTKDASHEHKSLRLRARREYLPLPGLPAWAH
jgi:hypothetical protein